MDTLHDLYVDELKDLYSAEKQLLKGLPKMAKAATNPKLKKAFEDHRVQTEEHIKRLEVIFEELEKSPKGKVCVGMKGLMEEGKEIISEKPNANVLDAGLISKAQHAEHYEMAGYGTVRTYAEQLGYRNHAKLLERTLNEEKKTDLLLTKLAESRINLDAERAD